MSPLGEQNAGWKCDRCGFELYLPVPADSLSVTLLGLYNDSRFPGRSLLAFEQHVEHMDELSPTQLHEFWGDATKVGAALRAITGADRINYAVLGNAEHHLHVHLIPRQSREEPLPSRPPWNDPRDLGELDSATLSDLRGSLRKALS